MMKILWLKSNFTFAQDTKKKKLRVFSLLKLGRSQKGFSAFQVLNPTVNSEFAELWQMFKLVTLTKVKRIR